MLRAPICTMSACSATVSTRSGSSASVTTASPVSSRARASSLNPGSPSPWKEYGEVRGLNAPPRRMVAPLSRICRAAVMIWVSDSTEHGPAIRTTSSPPIRVPLSSVMIVGSGRHSLDTCLYGRVTWMTCCTLGSASRWSLSTRPSLPTNPIAVRCAPGMGRAS